MKLFSLAMGLLLAMLAPGAVAAETNSVQFKKQQLDAAFRSEGVAVADFNNDGKLDIAAGSVYYVAPDWQMTPIWEQAKEYQPTGYSHSFNNFAEDLNGDGWADLIVVDWPGNQTYWYENPQTAGGPWQRRLIADVTNNESPQYVDVDGDGQRELVAATSPKPKQSDAAERYMAVFDRTEDPYAPWQPTAISKPSAPNTTRYAHGLGVGDINQDGRNDVVVPQGWWEQPADDRSPWAWHAAPLGDQGADMQVYDFDGDGDNDVLASSPHAYGIWWYEQTGEGWKKHVIDNSFSQTHAVQVADINGDGLPDFVTGKRWWAHAKGDPGVDEPAVLFWYELTREANGPAWIPHQIDHNSGVGTQFQIADLNADGLPDIVTSNKKGVYYFEQVRE